MADAVRGSLEPTAYHTAPWHELESRYVFDTSWLCVGLTSDLANDGDYLTADVGGRSVVVRRFRESLRAFENVCSHRGSRILAGPCGSGPLQCRYHGWTYDAAGCPVGLPGHRDDFGLSPAERQDLALSPFPVEAIGPFVFVGPAHGGESLATFLGAFHEPLARLGQTFTQPPFHSLTDEWDANWKLGVENTLEPLHAEFVHGDTLAQVVERVCEIDIQGRHSSIFHALQRGSRQWWDRMLAASGLVPDPDHQDYRHLFVYPNLCLGITSGTLLSVQTFEPVGPARCRLRQRLLLPVPWSDAGAAMRRTLRDFLIGFNRQVLDEDRVPVESCQRGMSRLRRPVLLARSEARVAAFQRSLFEQIPPQE